jgi:hypothetical protein
VKPRPVMIEWVDSCHWSPGQWVDGDIFDDGEATACMVVSVGWLMQKTDDAITLCQSITEADDLSGLFVIPRACVLSITTLTPGPQP